MLFAIPRGKVTYVGTSDTKYNGDKDKVLCTTSDIEYILNATNKMFIIETLKKEDVVSTWAGLRPLIYKLHSDSFIDYQEYNSFKESIKRDYADKGITDYDAWYFTTTYGKHAKQIIDTAVKSFIQLNMSQP